MHPEDDVARNIRNEQMADGAPTAEEGRRMYREHLREEGCAECDEDDIDKLDARYIPFPSCPHTRGSHDPNVVLCDECYDDYPTLRERAIQDAKDLNDVYDETDGGISHWNADDGRIVAITFFECEAWDYIHQPIMEGADGERYAHPRARPSTAIECLCGADISEIVRLSEVND